MTKRKAGRAKKRVRKTEVAKNGVEKEIRLEVKAPEAVFEKKKKTETGVPEVVPGIKETEVVPEVKTETEATKVTSEIKTKTETKRSQKKIKSGMKQKVKTPLWAKILIVVLSLIIVLMVSVAIFGYMLLSHTANVFKGNPMEC